MTTTEHMDCVIIHPDRPDGIWQAWTRGKKRPGVGELLGHGPTIDDAQAIIALYVNRKVVRL